MPTYLVHGFRWHRTAIRIHIALYNLDDAAAEWIIAPATSITLLNSFYTLYDFLPPSAPPVTLNGNPGGGIPLVLRNGGAVRSPTSNSNSASTLSGGASVECRGNDGEKGKGKEIETTQPHPVVKPSHTPPIQHSKSNSNGSTDSNETPTPTPTPTPKTKSPALKTLMKSKTRSMSSLRGLGRRRAERPPDLPDLPAGGFGNAAVATPINNSSTPRIMHRRRSTSTSIKRPSTGSTDQSRPGRPEVKKKPAFNEWSSVKLLEQFDPTDLRSGSQPYAYVADYMVEVKLGVSIGEEQARYEARAREGNSTTPGTPTFDTHMRRESSAGELSAREMRRKNRRVNWFEKLRDHLQKNEEVGWYVVVCGDEERFVPTEGDLTDVDEDEDYDASEERVKSPRSAGFRNFWTRRKNAPPPPRGQQEE